MKIKRKKKIEYIQPTFQQLLAVVTNGGRGVAVQCKGVRDLGRDAKGLCQPLPGSGHSISLSGFN